MEKNEIQPNIINTQNIKDTIIQSAQSIEDRANGDSSLAIVSKNEKDPVKDIYDRIVGQFKKYNYIVCSNISQLSYLLAHLADEGKYLDKSQIVSLFNDNFSGLKLKVICKKAYKLIIKSFGLLPNYKEICKKIVNPFGISKVHKEMIIKEFRIFKSKLLSILAMTIHPEELLKILKGICKDANLSDLTNFAMSNLGPLFAIFIQFLASIL